MSSPMAIAAVTATLRNLLALGLANEADLNDALVTAQPLDKARDAAATVNQLNLFLYLISPSGAWRNQDMPGRARSGDVASTGLGLNLFYLLSTYGRDNDLETPFSHLLLGQAMSTLNDHPILGRDEIAAALPNNDLGDQLERVRITLQPLSIEDISKLWAGFQMQYRLSVAYEVAVVLIDSRRPIRSGVPVLARGADGTGFRSSADLDGVYPRIRSGLPARPLRPGDTINATGLGLIGDTVTAQFASGRLNQPVQVPATLDATGGYNIAVPAGAVLPAGPCMFSLRFGSGTSVRPTVEQPLLVAPRITSPMPAVVSLAAGNPSIDLTIDPPALPGQRVALILGTQEIVASTIAGAGVTFPLIGIAVGTYLARVRVDGVDSLPVVNPDVPVPALDSTQTIQVTP